MLRRANRPPPDPPGNATRLSDFLAGQVIKERIFLSEKVGVVIQARPFPRAASTPRYKTTYFLARKFAHLYKSDDFWPCRKPRPAPRPPLQMTDVLRIASHPPRPANAARPDRRGATGAADGGGRRGAWCGRAKAGHSGPMVRRYGIRAPKCGCFGDCDDIKADTVTATSAASTAMMLPSYAYKSMHARQSGEFANFVALGHPAEVRFSTFDHLVFFQ